MPFRTQAKPLQSHLAHHISPRKSGESWKIQGKASHYLPSEAGLVSTMFFIVVILPYLLMNYPPSDISHPYSDEQARGRAFQEQWVPVCHSAVRKNAGLGPRRTSQPGDYFYDRPHLLARKNGPDLAQNRRAKTPCGISWHHRNQGQ